MIGFLAASPATGAFDVVAGFTSGQDKLDLSATDGVGVEIAYYEAAAFVYFAPSGGAFQGVVEVLGALTPDDLVLDVAARSNGVVIQGDATLPASASETLRGGAAADFIYCGSGHDMILGGGGADFLVGGSGADTFVYALLSDSTTTAQDLISNFNVVKAT